MFKILYLAAFVSYISLRSLQFFDGQLINYHAPTAADHTNTSMKFAFY